MITVHYSSIDYFRKTRRFKTIAGARKFAVKYVGADAEMGSHYAVSFDGVGKVTVDGCTLKELFAGKKTEVLPFEVWTYQVNEMGGTSRAYKAEAFATLAEANKCAEELEEYADGVHLVGTTDAAKAEIQAQADAFEAQIQRDRQRYNDPF